MRRFAAFLLLALLAPGGHAARAGASPIGVGLIGVGEVGSDELDAVPEWREALGRIAAEEPEMRLCAAEPRRCPEPEARRWELMLRAARPFSRRQQLVLVNSFANAVPYRSDAKLYGVNDRWAAPLEFLRNDGDCEDYAIFKYVSLRRLGMAPADLRLLVLRDTRRGIDHAVLAARAAGDWFILDNLSESVLPQAAAVDYAPYYAINEQHLWLYAPVTLPATAG